MEKIRWGVWVQQRLVWKR